MQGKFHERLKKTAAKPETAHGIRKRNGFFTRTRRYFLRFRYEKHTVPQRKTYGSHGGNIRFAEGKHKKQKKHLEIIRLVFFKIKALGRKTKRHTLHNNDD